MSQIFWRKIGKMSKFTTFLFVFLASFFLTISAFSSSYVSFGSLTFEKSIDQDDFSVVDEKIKGNGFGFQLGYFLTNPLALELRYSKSELEDSVRLSDGDKSRGEMTVIGIGFRYYLAEFFNILVGATNSEVKFSYVNSEEEEKLKESHSYYGAGFGLTFSKMQFYYDNVTYPSVRRGNTNVSILGVRAFF